MTNKELETIVRTLVERRLSENSAEDSGQGVGAESATLKVVTELEVREAGLGGTVWAASKALVTAAAEDLARAWGVTIVRGKPVLERAQRVAVGADHAGYEMKEEVKRFLTELDGMEVSDFGTHSNQTVDYPDFAHAVAEAVSSGKADFGIVVDGAGIGSAITANKVPGIRAAMCADVAMARNSREHNFANVLTLGARMIDEARMREIVKTFLKTANGEERHAARVRKIMRVEKKYRP